MQGRPHDEVKEYLSLVSQNGQMDNSRANQLKRRAAEEFREQLLTGAPTNEDEEGLRKLSSKLKAGQVVVKLHLRHPLHAKLYMVHRDDPINPAIAFVGSSNLTFSGLSKQGELNVDVLEHDACNKLQCWFEERWGDRFCVDISQDLAQIIDESWASERLIPPHHIYLKIAYHLSQEARAGLNEFRIPRDFGNRLFEFQEAAVRIAAHHLNKRGGVVIGDVVGLGKTLMATALAKIVEQDHPEWSTAIICPTNLQTMWQSYVDEYGLRARVIPLSKVETVLPDLPGRFRLLLIDESHNLRNREVIEIFDFVQRVLAINEHAGEKGIPPDVKEKFPSLPFDQVKHSALYSEVDRVLVKHYGFTDEELDFIINYDIKYRMGRDGLDAGA
jgi:hypothetical protein